MSELIKTNVTLADKNWFQTGGNAKFFAEPTNTQQLQESLTFAKNKNLQIFFLGHGANVLISDNGFNGLVIRPKNSNISINELDSDYVLVKSGAGACFQDLIDFCLENDISGLEEFSGIPGTVGGSVYINIHYYEFLLSHFLVSAEVIDIDTQNILVVDNSWFNFGYNQSKLHEKKHYLVSATFKLKRIDDIQAAYAKGRRDEIIRHRANKYPKSGTCGSFFRNFFEHEVSLQINEKKIIFVAYYLDKIGVKGALSVNNAIVSHQHANMIVNQGGAKTQDILDLAKKMQELVYKEFKILPQTECQLIGFENTLL